MRRKGDESLRTQQVRNALRDIFIDGFEYRNVNGGFSKEYLLRLVGKKIPSIQWSEITYIFTKDRKVLKKEVSPQIDLFDSREDLEDKYHYVIDALRQDNRIPAYQLKRTGSYYIPLTLDQFDEISNDIVSIINKGVHTWIKTKITLGSDLPCGEITRLYIEFFKKLKTLMSLEDKRRQEDKID